MPKTQRKGDFARGLETLLNNPQLSPLGNNGPAPFREMLKASGLSVCETMRYVGKKSKVSQKKQDEQRSEARIEKLEKDST